MSITVDYYKGQEPSDVQREYGILIKKEWYKFSKEDNTNMKAWMQKKGYFFERGKISIHKNNWEEKFKEFPWATLTMSEILNSAKIKEFSDYPIQYRCGNACLTYLTIDLLALKIDMDKYHKTRYDGDEEMSFPTYKCSYGMQLEEWEVRAIYAMMKNLENIEEDENKA